ncbi:MAG: hypothetical protein FWG45_07305 [Oscillospiraceae bacterium]|nr:hypothetical protein [Oscillospiraceae bacterium]
MAQTETRHAERTGLYRLLVAEYTGDTRSQIYQTQAHMETEDIEAVKRTFEEWKKGEEEKKNRG